MVKEIEVEPKQEESKKAANFLQNDDLEILKGVLEEFKSYPVQKYIEEDEILRKVSESKYIKEQLEVMNS